LSWVNNQNIFDGNSSVLVADGVRSGLAADPMTDRFGIYNNIVYDSTGTVVIREGFSTAFTNSADFGQTTPTQIRIRITDFPAGLRMTFPAVVTATENAGTLTTLEGADVILPRDNGNTDVFYRFNSVATSSDLVESFAIPVTVSVSTTVENKQPTIEVSLAPIGAAVPTVNMPSTSVPRFAEENLLVLEGTSRIITHTSYLTAIDNARENRLFLFNRSANATNLTLTALDAGGQALAGASITNAVRISLSANQSIDQTLPQLFGAGAANIAAVRVQGTGPGALGLATTSTAGRLESIELADRGVSNFVVPSVREAGRIYLFNTGAARLSGTLTLRSNQGAVIAAKTLDLEALASVSITIQEFFGAEADGQLSGSFPGSVIAVESFGSSSLNFISAPVPVGLPSIYVPFFATGGGYETDLYLLNPSEQTVTLTARLLGSTSSGSVALTIPPGQQLATTVAQLFGIQSLSSGYVRFELSPSNRFSPWPSYPPITGHARIRLGQTASTVIPISASPQVTSFILNSGVPAGYFQGIALANPNPSTSIVTLEALNSAGTVLGTATVEMAADQMASRLLTELFAVAIPEGSVIRVRATVPTFATSIVGSLTGDLLRSTLAIP
jgi:hypothetical protein